MIRFVSTHRDFSLDMLTYFVEITDAALPIVHNRWAEDHPHNRLIFHRFADNVSQFPKRLLLHELDDLCAEIQREDYTRLNNVMDIFGCSVRIFRKLFTDDEIPVERQNPCFTFRQYILNHLNKRDAIDVSLLRLLMDKYGPMELVYTKRSDAA